ncbi:trehalose synthase [Ferroplasma sp.]|uniref:trehalose synthase n=1 Tax=Ferroplasma sp. TaxID=2591003 RepID=UPI00261B8C86|nr:trehalose synthase [Ferroplasma sp.]MCL4453240.1 trehalose synthase [Candidatus Thermoplasmatota archaeon]
MDKTEKILWATSGVTLLQIMTGFYLSQISDAISSPVLIFHVFTAIILLVMAVASFLIVKSVVRLQHLAIVNTVLIIITIITGSGFIIFKSSGLYGEFMPYIQMLLSIGIISNYAVMLGIKRTLDMVQP